MYHESEVARAAGEELIHFATRAMQRDAAMQSHAGHAHAGGAALAPSLPPCTFADPAACAARVKDEELRAMRAQPVPWPYKSSDQSAAAVAWRNLSSVSWALQWLDDSLHLRGEAQYTAYRHPQRQLLLHPAVDDAKVSVRDLALGFELALGPMNLRKLVDAGMGVPMHGVYTQQSVTDVATLHRLLWRAKPSLLVEVGTMCGGSAIFYARTMMGYDPRAEVWTFDTNKNEGDRLAGAADSTPTRRRRSSTTACSRASSTRRGRSSRRRAT